MDLQLKQWRSQQQNESEEQQAPVTKMSNFYFDQIQSQTPTCAALPLFEPTSSSSSRLSSFSCFSPPDSSYSPSFRLPKMGSLFTWAQWQELELQALIFRYMLVGAAVPQELLLPIKKSLMLRSPSHFLQHPLQHPLQHFPHQQPPWYWGRGAMDPEPGRCKRTDGKKWRCSRDVVAGHKYCERHIHRGRNRSRKPVEIPSPSPNPNPNSTITATATSRAIVDQLDTACGGHGATLHSSSDQLLHLNQSYSEMKQESNNNNNNKRSYEFSNGGSDDGHTLRHFFDDWPRSSDSTSSSINSATCLSISMPENVSSDVSLKLFTGNEEEELRNGDNSHGREEQNMMSWWSNGGNQQQQEMGGPLAEALRSASSSSSPTSVLRRLGISTQVFN